MESIYVLFTTINGRKNYVAPLMQNSMGNKKIVNYTTEAAKAKDFGSLAEAEKFIPHIANPHERIFTADMELIEPEKKRTSAVTEDLK